MSFFVSHLKRSQILKERICSFRGRFFPITEGLYQNGVCQNEQIICHKICFIWLKIMVSPYNLRLVALCQVNEASFRSMIYRLPPVLTHSFSGTKNHELWELAFKINTISRQNFCLLSHAYAYGYAHKGYQNLY